MKNQRYLIVLLLFVAALFTLTVNLTAAISVQKVWQPDSQLAPANTRVSFMQFLLLSDTTERVDGITIQTTGTDVSVYRQSLLENGFGDIVGTIGIRESNTQFMPLSLIVKAGEPVYLTLKGDMERIIDSGYSGTIIGTDVVAIWTGATVSGSLPLVGTRHTVNTSLQVGGITSTGRKGSHQNITAGENQVLGSIEVTTSSAENMLVYGLPIEIHSTGGDPSRIRNLVAMDQNGAIIASSRGTSVLRKEYGHAMFALYSEKGGIVLPKGTSTIFFKGDTTDAFSRGGTIAVETNPSEWNAYGVLYGYQGAVSGLGSVLSATSFVLVPRLDVSTTSPQYMQVNAGTLQVPTLSILLDATKSREDIRVTQIPILMVTSPQWKRDLSQLTLYDGSTLISWFHDDLGLDDGIAQLTLYFGANGFVVPKGTAKTVTVKLNISPNAIGFYGIALGDFANVDGVALQSGKTPTMSVTIGYTIVHAQSGKG